MIVIEAQKILQDSVGGFRQGERIVVIDSVCRGLCRLSYVLLYRTRDRGVPIELPIELDSSSGYGTLGKAAHG